MNDFEKRKTSRPYRDFESRIAKPVAKISITLYGSESKQ
jgi:hypothetical protein